jgi:hypothetical protein|tara:strand:- start:1242 stop:1529 length:288 start_codon:yes stop_codon:yes gene_type:complete
MASGIQIKDSAGNITYDSSSVGYNLLGVYEAPQNSSATFTGIPIMGQRIVVRQMWGADNTDKVYAHTFVLSGTTLTVTAPSSSFTQATTFQVFGR